MIDLVRYIDHKGKGVDGSSASSNVFEITQFSKSKVEIDTKIEGTDVGVDQYILSNEIRIEIDAPRVDQENQRYDMMQFGRDACLDHQQTDKIVRDVERRKDLDHIVVVGRNNDKQPQYGQNCQVGRFHDVFHDIRIKIDMTIHAQKVERGNHESNTVHINIDLSFI